MKKILSFYTSVCAVLVSLTLFFGGIAGILHLCLENMDSVSDYKIVQYPEQGRIITTIWGKRYDDLVICYANSVVFTVSSFDSISFAEKLRAEKLVKSFEKLNNN